MLASCSRSGHSFPKLEHGINLSADMDAKFLFVDYDFSTNRMKISGLVIDQTDSVGLIGAYVTVLSDKNEVAEAATDLEGIYHLDFTHTGSDTILIRCVGFNDKKINVTDELIDHFKDIRSSTK